MIIKKMLFVLLLASASTQLHAQTKQTEQVEQIWLVISIKQGLQISLVYGQI